MALPRLIVLAPSHYCERARWALDHAGIAYDEVRWAPALHMPLARRIAAGTSLPILQIDGQTIQGSDRILDWIGTPGGDPEIERRFDEVIGPLCRRTLYAATLHDPSTGIREALLDGVSPTQYRAGRVLWPLIRRLMIARMNARAILRPQLEARLDGELAWFDSLVGDRPHLVGEQLGRADITAASLLAPLVRQPALTPLYQRVRLPDCLERTLATWGQRPALTWVRRLYRTHRPYSSLTRSR